MPNGTIQHRKRCGASCSWLWNRRIKSIPVSVRSFSYYLANQISSLGLISSRVSVKTNSLQEREKEGRGYTAAYCLGRESVSRKYLIKKTLEQAYDLFNALVLLPRSLLV